MAKYIELCDICSIHRTKVNKQTKTKKRSEKYTDCINISTATSINEGTETNNVLGTHNSKTQENVTVFDTAHKENDIQKESESTCTINAGTRAEEILAERQLDNIIDYIHTSSNCV